MELKHFPNRITSYGEGLICQTEKKSVAFFHCFCKLKPTHFFDLFVCSGAYSINTSFITMFMLLKSY